MYHVYAIGVDKDEVIRHLAEIGIACGIHYPVPVHLQEAYQKLGYAEGAFPIAEQAAGVRCCLYKLGPILLEIGRTGIQFDILPKEQGKPAALGFADADIRFKPPSEIGFVVDAKLIEGGGFLFFDPASGDYFGVAYLTLKRKLEIKAVGIIQTRMPDGSEGFSFLLIITFELPSKQPGMGFRLEGIGGLVGIHRTIDREALVVGMPTTPSITFSFPTTL